MNVNLKKTVESTASIQDTEYFRFDLTDCIVCLS
jgi:hypothetical protein